MELETRTQRVEAGIQLQSQGEHVHQEEINLGMMPKVSSLQYWMQKCQHCNSSTGSSNLKIITQLKGGERTAIGYNWLTYVLVSARRFAQLSNLIA